jgi:hypothetical protein
MVIAVSGEAAAKGRRTGTTSHGETRWYTDFIGELVEKVEDRPQSHLTEMDANQSIVPHFHEVNQFQVMVAGSGSIGRNQLPLLALHYADHHTAYGPILAGPCGLSLFTVRAQSDPRAIFLNKPGYKDFLKPSKKRYIVLEGVPLSGRSSLQYRGTAALDSVLSGDIDTSDGLDAAMLRLGGGMRFECPDPRQTGGQYLLVLNGSLEIEAASYAAWSVIFVDRVEAPLQVCAGPMGAEALVLNFPRLEADWMKTFGIEDRRAA